MKQKTEHKKPIITVIIAVYNNEKYFPIAIESVLSQKFNDFEIIIVDDGSTDNTGKLADAYAKKDSRVHVIHQNNQWIYASFNRGIAESSGEYIYILNSDDKLAEGALSVLADIVYNYNPDVIWTKVLVHSCDSNQRIIRYDFLKYGRLVQQNKFYQDVQSVRENWINFLQWRLIYNQANLYRASIAKNNLFRNDVYGADQFYNITIASEIHSAYMSSYPVYHHFIYEQSDMNVATGHYYGYEHQMYNELFEKNQALFIEWDMLDNKVKKILSAIRLENLTFELKGVLGEGCKLSDREKLCKIFSESVDDLVYQCAQQANLMEELESRILSICRQLFLRYIPKEEDKLYFAYELLVSLLRYEKDEKDLEKIRHAVYNKNNSYHIGESFYKKLQKEEGLC